MIIKRALYKSLIYSKKYANGILLDVGCGTKPYKSLFGDVARIYYGVDIPPERSANKQEKNIDIYADIIIGLPFRSSSIDTVLCTEVIEHVPEPGKLFREINRVMKPGGYLILSAPQVWGLHEEPRDFYRYTKYGLHYLAESNNFELGEIIAHCGIWGTVGQRLSSFIHYHFVDSRNLMIKLSIKPIYIILQQLCLLLDRLFGKSGDTLGNILIAKKLER